VTVVNPSPDLQTQHIRLSFFKIVTRKERFAEVSINLALKKTDLKVILLDQNNYVGRSSWLPNILAFY